MIQIQICTYLKNLFQLIWKRDAREENLMLTSNKGDLFINNMNHKKATLYGTLSLTNVNRFFESKTKTVTRCVKPATVKHPRKIKLHNCQSILLLKLLKCWNSAPISEVVLELSMEGEEQLATWMFTYMYVCLYIYVYSYELWKCNIFYWKRII